MKKDKSNKANNYDLRNKAEKIYKHASKPVGVLTNAEARELAHELQVYQIELQAQNEELRKAHVELEESRNQYSRLYDFAPVGYFTIGDKGIILKANLTSAEMLGTERSLLIGKPLSLFIMEEDADIYHLEHNKVCKTGGHGTCELRMIRDDGTQLYVHMDSTPVLGAEGDSTQCMTTMSDITERKKIENSQRQLEKELRSSERRMSALLEKSPVCTKVVDLDFNLKYMSAAGIKALKVDDVTTLYGKPYPFDFFPESFKDSMTKNLKKVKQTGEIITEEAPVCDIEGSELWFQATLVPVIDIEGLEGYIIVVSVDISERKKMEAALIQSEKLKSMGMITAGISHEFNNILNIISGNVQLLQMDYKDHHRLMDSLHIIKESIDKGSSIADRMCEFTHPDTSDMDFEPADINILIERSVEFTMPRWKSMAQSKGLDYSIDMEGMKNVSFILCNPIGIGEVLINIINNALDAMPDGGTLSFRTWGKDDTVFASITDTGKGMPDDVKKNIFDPFFTTRRPKGTGLGLSTSYTKIVRCGGKIEVDSEVGKGSAFTLQFPAANKKEDLISSS